MLHPHKHLVCPCVLLGYFSVQLYGIRPECCDTEDNPGLQFNQQCEFLNLVFYSSEMGDEGNADVSSGHLFSSCF